MRSHHYYLWLRWVHSITYLGNAQWATKLLNCNKNSIPWNTWTTSKCLSKMSVYRAGIWQRNICHANQEKRKATNNVQNWTTKSRKNQSITMQKALSPRDDVDRRYVGRKEERRGHASIEDSVDTSIRRLEDYIEKSKGRLITAARNI